APAGRRFRPEAYSADDGGRAARRRCSHGGVRVARSAGSALVRLRESLVPLAERYGRALSSALASLETLRLAPSQAVERSRPTDSRRPRNGGWPQWGNSCRITSGHDRLECAPQAAIRLAGDIGTTRPGRLFRDWPMFPPEPTMPRDNSE